MRRAMIFIALLLATAAPAPARGASDESRRALDQLVGRLTGVLPRTGPSLTRCVADLVACGHEEVRAVLAEFWAQVKAKQSVARGAAVEVEDIVRLMYGLPPSARQLSPVTTDYRILGGAVLDCEPDGRSGVGLVDMSGPHLPPLEELLAKGKLRPAPVPDPALLMAALERGEPKKWSMAQRRSYYGALGEVADEKVVAVLVKRFEAGPPDEEFVIALGRANSPASRAALLRAVRAGAKTIAAGIEDRRKEEGLRWKLRRVAAPLAARAPDVLRKAIADATGKTRQVLLELAGHSISMPLLLDAFERAETGPAKVSAWRPIADVILAQDGDQFPRAADIPRLLDAAFAVASDLSKAERSRLWWAIEWQFYAHNRYPIRSPGNLGGVSFSEEGGSLGPYPDMPTLARNLVEDLAADRLRILDWGKGPSVFDPPARRLGYGLDRAHSAEPPPEGWSKPEPGFPVFARGEMEKEGLRITLHNRGHEPFLVNPLIGRYARAELMRVRRKALAKVLLLDLGFIRSTIAVPRKALVTVDPGKSFSWRQPIRSEHRDVDRIVIRITGCEHIVGGTKIPWLSGLNDTWIR